LLATIIGKAWNTTQEMRACNQVALQELAHQIKIDELIIPRFKYITGVRSLFGKLGNVCAV
jgi:hypothetical protein